MLKMNNRIDYYYNLFANLKGNRNKKAWSEITKHKAPYKPLLLLAICDLFSSASIKENFIPPSEELIDTINDYWSIIMPFHLRDHIAYPFYHLSTSTFWHLIPQLNKKHKKEKVLSSVGALLKYYEGVKIDGDLFILLNKKQDREILRKALIEEYFIPEIHQALWHQAIINQYATDYSTEIIEHPEKLPNEIKEISPILYQKARSQGFRKAIVKIYKHRCALCGIRILTPEGHTIIEAAHIIPWSETQNDKPQNGMALCRLCHWSFDEGLMGVDTEYNVLISPKVQQDGNYSGHMEMLSNRGIIKPKDELFWPSQENLEHHRDTRFRN
jgi:putative restriction endonuclease